MAEWLSNWKAEVALRFLQEGRGMSDGDENEGFHLEMFSLRFAPDKQQKSIKAFGDVCCLKPYDQIKDINLI